MERILRLQESARVRPSVGNSPVTAGETGKNGFSNKALSGAIGVPESTIEKWKAAIRKGTPIESPRYPNFALEWKIGTDGLWYRVENGGEV